MWNVICAVLVLLSLGATVLFLVAGNRAVRRKRHTLAVQHQQLESFPQWAAQRRMTYTRRDDRWARIGTRYPLGAGFEQRAEHIFHGTVDGWEMAAFQYGFVIKPTGRDSDQHDLFSRLDRFVVDDDNRAQITIVATRLPAPRPYLAIAPEDWFSKAAQRAGRRDVRLEHHGFNERFNVRTDSDRFAYDVLHPRTMDWMMRHPAAGRMNFVIDGAWLYMRAGGPITLHDLDGHIAVQREFVGKIPTHVWRY